MHFLFEPQDGYYSLTSLGFSLFVLLMVLIVVSIALISGKRRTTEQSAFSTKQVAYAGMALALAFALSYIKLFHMPWGGSVTLCSMLFVVLIGYWYGPKVGLLGALAYSILQFVQGGGGYILSFWQVMFDYFLAFTALGVAGFFYKKKNGLLIGYVVAVCLRGIFHSVGGYLYWMEYMPDNFPKALSAVYPILYNFAYIGVECLITVALLLIPPVKNAIKQVTRDAQI